jgi:uncharacterized protein YdeI (YjbR/CyaY-like superfamily)
MSKSLNRQHLIVRFMAKTKELHFVDRHDWRSWLEKNHETKREAWLIFYKKHTGTPNVTYDDAVEEALCFGWIDSIIKRIDHEKFARKFTPRKLNSRWSGSNKKRATKMINEGKMMKTGLELIVQAKNCGEWNRTCPTRKDLAIPEYFEKALKSNEKALNTFNKLGTSYKRQYIGWVNNAKKEETRKRRLSEAIRILEKGEKLGMK